MGAPVPPGGVSGPGTVVPTPSVSATSNTFVDADVNVEWVVTSISLTVYTLPTTAEGTPMVTSASPP